MNLTVMIDSTPTKNTCWVGVCQLEDLLENIGLCALVDGQQVALFRTGNSDKVYGIANHDPFSHANVLSRGIVGEIGGREVVASPIYKQHFELSTGICLEDDSVSITTYPTRINNGLVEVALD